MTVNSPKHIIATEKDGAVKTFASMNRAAKHYNVNVNDVFLCVNGLKTLSEKAGNVFFKIDNETEYPNEKTTKEQQEKKRKLYQLARYYFRLYEISNNKENFVDEHKNLKGEVLTIFKRMCEE